MMRILCTALLCLCLGFSAYAQQDWYVDEIYESVQVTEDVVYGVNATVEQIYFLGVVVDTLKMDVYEPIDDPNETRPLMIVLHDGVFLQKQINGRITGERRDSSVVDICTKFAKRGYTAVAIDYRLGWNPLAATYTERGSTFVQAVYRGMQDGRTAVRYFRKDIVENGNQFNVDESSIAVWGLGTGGFISLAMNSVASYEDLIENPNFILDVDGNGVPDVPMIIEEYYGDMNGELLTIVPDDPTIPEIFNLTVGDTMNYPNHTGYSSEIHIALNPSGGILATEWLDAGDNPSITFQDINDPLVYYEDNLILPPFIDLIFPFKGAYYIGETQSAVGNYDVWDGWFLNEPLTQLAMEQSNPANHVYYQGVYPFTKAQNSAGYYEGIPIDWWDPNALAVYSFNGGDPLPWNQTLSNNGMNTIHEQSLLLNENMSAEKARANIDTLIQYAAPRLCVALNLACMAVATEEIAYAEDIGLSVFPNPASQSIQFKTNDVAIETIELYDLFGKMIQRVNVQSHAFTLERVALPNGIYIVKLTTNKGILSEKVVFQ